MNQQQYSKNLGNALSDLRHELSLTQEAFAERAGMSGNYLGTVERGEKNISVYLLYRLLTSVQVPISKFLEKV